MENDENSFDDVPFDGLGAEDRIRKPERKNATQWLIIAAGMSVMTFGGLWCVGAVVWKAMGHGHITFSLPGFGIMAAGYAIYQSNWRYRDKK